MKVKWSKFDFSNCRPTLLLRFLSKTFEKVHNLTVEFLTGNCFVYKHKPGSKGIHSIDVYLPYLADEVLNASHATYLSLHSHAKVITDWLAQYI